MKELFSKHSYSKISLPFFVMAGPDIIEDAVKPGQTLEFAEKLKKICQEVSIPLIFKVSYDKANRTSLKGFRGPGLKASVDLFRTIRDQVDVPILSDVHSIEEIEIAADVLDVIQIPAFLSRQTDLLVEVARTGKVVNWKKGQFIAPQDVGFAIEKMASTGNEKILLTERGYMFGYNNMVVDMRSIPIMKSFDFPVIIDATHSIQLPSGGGGKSSGERQFVPTIAQAAVAAGADGVFMETHAQPDEALCDGPNMIPMDKIAALLTRLQGIHALVRN